MSDEQGREDGCCLLVFLGIVILFALPLLFK